MKVFTRLEYKWDNGYILDKVESFEYVGEISLCCGASQQQTQTYQSQAALTQTLITQMQSEFGAASGVFNDLVSTFNPILQEGPNQQGFSPAEVASLNTSAIDTTAAQYESARQSIGEQEAAMGGGNIALPSGAAIAPQLALSEKAAQQTSSELNQIQQANYTQGRANWVTAAQGLSGASGVFSPANSAGGISVGSGSAQSNTANEIAQQNNSWQNALIGAGAGIAGSVITDQPWG